MEIILHALGLCHDSYNHLDFLDILYANHNKLHVYTAYIKLFFNF